MAKTRTPSHTKGVTGQTHEFKLGKWHVTPLRGVIHGPDGNRRITPKSMDVLLCLARRPGEVVDRDTFQEEVWQGRVFSDDPLNKCIAELRRQLGDRSGSRDYIETIPKRGYRLVAEVTPIAESMPTDTRTGFRRHLRIASLVVLLGFAALGVWRFWENMVPRGDITIAVLPFANLSQSGKQYFADGVHEELIGELSQGDALAVRSRASTLQYREREKPLTDIARELGVDVIVDGSVRQDGDTVRVSAQLVQADADRNLWAGSIEKSLTVASLFSIQNEIALEIADALKVRLGDETSAAAEQLPTDNIDAYDAFMLGKFHYRRQLPGDIRESVVRFERYRSAGPGFRRGLGLARVRVQPRGDQCRLSDTERGVSQRTRCSASRAGTRTGVGHGAIDLWATFAPSTTAIGSVPLPTSNAPCNSIRTTAARFGVSRTSTRW